MWLVIEVNSSPIIGIFSLENVICPMKIGMTVMPIYSGNIYYCEYPRSRVIDQNPVTILLICTVRTHLYYQ